MFSSPPRPRHDTLPLPVTAANLQRLDERTQREFQQYLKEYATAQSRNRGVYAAQGENQRKTWKAEEPRTYQGGEKMEGGSVYGIGSPLLKARVHMREGERWKEKTRGGHEDRASTRIKENVTRSDKDKEEGHERANKSRVNQMYRKRDEDEDTVRETNERTERLAQRRARRRVKQEITKPAESMKKTQSDNQKRARKRKQDEEEGSDNNSDGTRMKKRRKCKVPLGISLMENFTAKNVAHGRLTLPPPSRAGLFNKGRASVMTEIRRSRKENRCPVNIFSEYEFLNKHNPLRGTDDDSSSSSSTARKTCSSVLSLSPIRRQDDRRVKRPSERRKKASLPPDRTEKYDSRRSAPSRSDTTSDQHSASWGVGSVLPSDDESVQVARSEPSKEPRQRTVIVEEVDRGTSPAVPSRQTSPEVVIQTVPSKWSFDEAGDVGGRCDLQVPAERPPLQDKQVSLEGESDNQGAATFRSRFFSAQFPSPGPPLPSPLQICDGNEQYLQEPTEELHVVRTEFTTSLSGELDQEAPFHFEAAAPYIAHSTLQDDYISPEEHMTYNWAMEGSVYQHNPGLTVAHFIDGRLGPGDFLDDSGNACLSFQVDEDVSRDSQSHREPAEKYDSRQDLSCPVQRWGHEYCDTFNDQNANCTMSRDATDLEHTMQWNDDSGIKDGPCESFFSGSQDYNREAYDDSSYHDRFTSVGVDGEAYHQGLPADTLADEEPLKGESCEAPFDYDGQFSEEQNVMLDFSEGRTLLMGMGDGILAEEPMREYSTGGVCPRPYRLQFGQSVNEIEVMVGKNLGNPWKR